MARQNKGVTPSGSGQSAEPEPVSRLRHSVTVPNAADCDSFGEYASRCHARGHFEDALYRQVSDLLDASGWKPRRVK